ncbi:MAG TPA: 6,7-dimethyl-8-ribityllumazine synthase [Vicinamibacterales bacterium]|nr:6,7-dimethyl-8-ribityllumazine synthase [Vicinamibacterales bacterium]
MELQGSRHASGRRFAIVVSSFNKEFAEGLLRGARAALSECGVSDADVTIVRVPGAFEIPLAARHLIMTERFDAVVCLGCLIKGDTMHFEYISESVSHGLMAVSADTGVPVTFGVLTTLTEEQAAARAADGPDNKGREAALAAVEMTTIVEAIGGLGQA